MSERPRHVTVDYLANPHLAECARQIGRNLAPLVPVLLANLGYASMAAWERENPVPTPAPRDPGDEREQEGRAA